MNEDVLRIFIGYDPVESVAWHTMVHSIYKHSSVPVAVIPVNVRNLGAIYKRPRDPKQSNEFSFTRFLVPYLADFRGFAIFFDCDMILRTDVKRLMDLARQSPQHAVHVVKHDYEPRDKVKYLDTVQYSYPRKNWSSVIAWNCAHPSLRVLTPEFVNQASGIELHRFLWLKDEEIGELDVRWNWLVGEYSDPPPDVWNIHWTVGGPYFKEYRQSDFADEWFEEFKQMSACIQRDEVKGAR